MSGKVGYILFFLSMQLFGQNDTITLANKDVLAGEIKSFSSGVLILETSYSDKDFKIEFNKITGLTVQRRALVFLTEGRRRFGNIKTAPAGSVLITSEDGTVERFELHEIIGLQEVNDNFWERFKGSVDLGLNLTKANKTTQFTIGGDMNYIDESWLVDGNLNVLNATREDAEKTKRIDANLEFYRLLPREWYLLGDVTFLSNTEQALEGRIGPSIGIGKFIISTNKLHLALGLGFMYNIENYVDTSLNKSSSEAYIALTYRMFDFEDIDLDTSVKFYPSLSEKGRVRTDYDFTLKYDLPLDFYVKMGFTLNFDNQPASIGNNLDYILSSGFGWEFD